MAVIDFPNVLDRCDARTIQRRQHERFPLESRNTPTGSVLQGATGKLSEDFHSENFYFRERLPWQGASVGLDFENNRATSNNPFVSLTPFYNTRLPVSYSQPLWRNREIDSGRAELIVRRKQVGASDLEFELRVIASTSRSSTARPVSPAR